MDFKAPIDITAVLTAVKKAQGHPEGGRQARRLRGVETFHSGTGHNRLP